jgi:hypothetical protein
MLCRLCARTRGIDRDVRLWRRHDDVVCHTHQRWPGPEHDALLHDHPEVLRANKLHKKLIAAQGRYPVLCAFTDARDIITEWLERRNRLMPYYERMDRFHGDTWRVHESDPTVHASLYPIIVALTRLLVVPYWTNLALGNVENPAAFEREMQRTVDPHYTWYPHSWHRYYDPVVRWFRDELDRRRSPGDWSPNCVEPDTARSEHGWRPTFH